MTNNKLTNKVAIEIAVKAINEYTLTHGTTIGGFDNGEVIAKLEGIIATQEKKSTKDKERRKEKADAAKNEKREAILEVLEKDNKPKTCGDIADAIGVAFQSITRLLATMADEGILGVTEIKVEKGKKKAYYKIDAPVVEGEVE